MLYAEDPHSVQSLSESLQVSSLIASLLLSRKIRNITEAKTFFNPSLEQLHDPFLMKDMDKAVDRIYEAIAKNEKILVYGDYDVDGTTAVASFYQFLIEIYHPEKVEFYIPNRYTEGYGVSKKGIDFAKEHDFTLVVCLDCGIKSVDLIDYANSIGVNFIICDHHQPGPMLPVADAILNPKQTDCDYPYKDLCGCGVGFKLMTALAVRHNLHSDVYLKYLDMVAIAIAADIVPITGENRILAHFGLNKINNQPSLGISAILKLTGATLPLTITNVVFMIAPRINAAGRMDDARKAVLLFVEQDLDTALRMAGELQQDNSERKEKDADITAEALNIINNDATFIDRKSCVLFAPHWHKGVVGIVASRIIEHHYRPTIVLTQNDGIATGSARSIKGFNLYEAIYECRDLLTAFGGHFAAAGLSLLPENIAEFSKRFEKAVQSSVTDDMLVPTIEINAMIQFKQINPSLYKTISRMEPFGPENMKPVFWAKNVTNNGNSRILKDQHIKFELNQDGVYMTGIGFNMAEKFPLISSSTPFDIAFTIDQNTFKGNTNLQLIIIDVQPTQTN